MNTNPPGSQYTIDEYQILLMIEEEVRLLVEGSDDKHLFDLLVDEINHFKVSENESKNESFIVEASDLIENKSLFGENDDKKIGNREKVEKICELLENDPNFHKFIGFVDREFREFEYQTKISDKIRQHYYKKRVLWTRGHSIENYFFDSLILRSIIKIKLSESWFKEAISIFEKHLESAITIACAIGMAAKNNNKIERIQKSIHWTMFAFENEFLRLNTEKWGNSLADRQRLENAEIESLIADFNHWIQKFSEVDYEVIKWLCHGHVGAKCTLSFFYFCISRACPDKSKPEKYLSNFKYEEYFNACAYFWVKYALEGRCEHPFDYLKKMGLALV